MIVKQFLLNVHEVNSFVVSCATTRESMIVDAGDFDDRIAAYLHDNGLILTTIFITHDHYDHVDGVAEYVKRYAPDVISGTPSVGGCEAQVVKHGDRVAVGQRRGTVLSTPGHTPVGLSLAFSGHVFTGDALFAGSVGGTGSSADYEMQNTAIRQHIFTLPPDTLVHTGHGPSTTVEIEKAHNPFFHF